ncbi:hypothetical protein EVAR_46086_1 [Eumeta japonica]|uniref:U4/U6.U5 tri-snRNP-associated protein 1 n=1 Tax=Eumeta variegata TaxID=151549 RepID=A0A4C1XIN6_EUMVA|nr:hypothetical protein EVAR_46086_1 [Eumeta japonica]
MGSKKHKKDSKKKKHKSRSRSLSPGAEKERKHHRKHKDRKKARSPDVEEVPVDSHLYDPHNGDANLHSNSREEHERDTQKREELHRERREESKESKERDRSPVASTSNAESLSIEDTNKLRIKLGLKPLEVSEKPTDDGKIKDDLGEFYHKPAANLSEQKQTEKIREKLQERKEKRKLEKKLQNTTLIAELSDDEDASAWVKKSRIIEKQKEEAARRAAMLDEMDEVFGVGALVADEVKADRERSYTDRDLHGLRVAHDLDILNEGHDVVLTLADKNVLEEDNEDILVNVNIVDNEKYKKNIQERKKAKLGYQAYEDEEDIEKAALGIAKPVLAKYDDEINKGKMDKNKGFVIGDEDGLEAKKFRQMMIKERLAAMGEKRLETLSLPALKIASDYLDDHEISTKFKKPKRKGKLRKKAKEEPIDVEEYDPNAAPLDTDDTDVKPSELKLEAIEEEEVEPDSELQTALARARRLRQAEALERKVPKVEEILECVKEEPSEAEEQTGGAMVLDATAEFCRTLGDIPTYGLAGNRDTQLEIMDFEQDDIEPELDKEEGAASGAWSRVDVNADKPADITATSSGALEAEPSLGAGVAGALQLAISKGYLDRRTTSAASRASTHSHILTARHYSIEDKTYGEDDKYGRRERGHHGSGPTQEFREKSNFRPTVKLEYVDDDGRPLSHKEAFRYLSHKFHGKGPGKNKQEKRLKKAMQEGLMKKMSSTDTPLGTLAMLQEKQRETHSPYVVLSGARRDQHH